MSDPSNVPQKLPLELTTQYRSIMHEWMLEVINLNQEFYASLHAAGCGAILSKWFEDTEAMRLIHRAKIDALYERYERGEL